jgi:hypothetical protein
MFARKTNIVKKLDIGFEPDAGVSGAVVLQDESSTFFTFNAIRKNSDGMSQYPVGQHPSLIYATRPQDSAITEIDNIVLNGELAPPPHFTQASGASWQNHLLLGSIDPGDTIAKYGCFLTSTAMLLQHFGHNTDPASLNAHVIATAPQSDGFLRFGELIPDAQGTYGQSDGWGASPVRFHHAMFSHTSTRSTIVASLEQVIRDSGPVILRVPQYGNGMKDRATPQKLDRCPN